jgi:photosystem II stability/assembly factor-like uncharacterized protein
MVSPAMAQWVSMNGPYGGRVQCLAFVGTNLFAGTYGSGVFLSTDNGAVWTAVDSGLTDLHIQALVTSDTNLFAGSAWDGIFLSTNNGKNWAAVNNGLGYRNITSFALIRDSLTHIFAGAYQGVYASTNNGTLWTLAPILDPAGTSEFVISLAADGRDLYAGTTGGGVYRSTNYGAKWAWLPSGMARPPVRVEALAKDGGTLFAGVAQNTIYLPPYGLFESTDSGASWKTANNGISNSNYGVYGLAISGTNVFASGYDSVFLSIDQGASWQSVSAGLLDNYFVLAVNGSNLFGGAWGVWRRPLSEMVTAVPASESTIPTAFNLLQNYPNPFNPTTTITYTLPASGHVKLSVFNMLGQEVATLVNESQSPGFKSVSFNATRLPSGMYTYRIVAGTFTDVKKMVLIN